MGLISTFLFSVASIPQVYFPQKRHRTIYTAVVAPLMWALLLASFYIFIYRPLINCTTVYAHGKCCNTDDGYDVYLMTKETHQINEQLKALEREAVDLRIATELLNRQMGKSGMNTAGAHVLSEQVYEDDVDRQPFHGDPA